MTRHYLKEAIFRALAAHPYGLNGTELVEKVYRGTNEPEYARDSIYVTLHMMRKMTLPFVIKRVRHRYQLFFP